jgi:hypothetical protein
MAVGYRTFADMREDIERITRQEPADQKNYWVAHLGDGVQVNSQHCNWGNVPLHEIVMLELHMRGHKHRLVRRELPGFVEFVFFQTGKSGLGSKTKCLSRSIGWHNGEREYVIRVDERTGRQIRDANDQPLDYAGVMYSHTESPPRHLHATKSKMILGNTS